jgi:hypothetical protein
MTDHDRTQVTQTADPQSRRLLHVVSSVARMTDDERPSVSERLLVLLGQACFDAVRVELAATASAREATEPDAVRPCAEVQHSKRVIPVSRFARLRRWQLSLFLVALGCGAAVGLVGTIDLIWQGRFLVSGIGAVALVVSFFMRARHHQVPETWIGS